jgi:hypothetical protein
MDGTWLGLVLWGVFTALACLGLFALGEPALLNMALVLIASGLGGLLGLAAQTVWRHRRPPTERHNPDDDDE